MNWVTRMAFLIGALLGSWLLLRLLMYGFKKVRGHPNNATEIAFAGVLVLLLTTIGGGYGIQDGLSDPQFIRAFHSYFGPSMLVTVIELIRLDRQRSRTST